MRLLMTAAVILGVSGTAFAQTGVYTLEGQNIDGKTYTGILSISEQDGEYVLQWELQAGDTAEGRAFLDGDTLTYICRAVSPDGSATGLAYGHFKLGNGQWKGKWSSPGLPGAGAEVLTPTKKTIERLREDLKAKKVAA